MASAKLSPILQDLKGSINGDTFSHVRSGLILKNKSRPGSQHPFTPSQYQINMINYFKIAAGHWKYLTTQQIIDWCNLARSIPVYNKFGESYYQAGFNLYCKLNQNAQLIGSSIYDDAPTLPAINQITHFTCELPGTVDPPIILDFSSSPTDSDVIHLIYATPPISLGRNYVKNMYRIIGLIDPHTFSPFDITTFYYSRFHHWPTNQQISIKLMPFHRPDGFPGTPLIEFFANIT